MPCDTVQINELQMIGLDLDMVAKSFKALGVKDVVIDRKKRTVVSVNGQVAYSQKNGKLEYNQNARDGTRFCGVDPDKAERMLKREYIWQRIIETTSRYSDRGWTLTTNAKGKKVLRKKTGFASSQFGEGSSDNSGTFHGFCWGKKH
ncbi:MAG: hypothetical protein ACWGQW_03840 [bacterium]